VAVAVAVFGYLGREVVRLLAVERVVLVQLMEAMAQQILVEVLAVVHTVLLTEGLVGLVL
jgi:hypothetical protein